MIKNILLTLLLVSIFIPDPAQAYIDPGLGGQIFQLFYLIFFSILAFVVSPTLFFWKRIRARLELHRRDKNVKVNDKQSNKDA